MGGGRRGETGWGPGPPEMGGRRHPSRNGPRASPSPDVDLDIGDDRERLARGSSAFPLHKFGRGRKRGRPPSARGPNMILMSQLLRRMLPVGWLLARLVVPLVGCDHFCTLKGCLDGLVIL